MAGVQRLKDSLVRAGRNDDSPTVEKDEAVVDAEAVSHRLILAAELRRQASVSAPQRGQQGLVLQVSLSVLGEKLLVRSRGIVGDESRTFVPLVAIGRGSKSCRVRLVAAAGDMTAPYSRRAPATGPHGSPADRSWPRSAGLPVDQ